MISVWVEIASLISASLVLVAALAWNDAFRTLFQSQTIFKDPLAAALIYAIAVTIIAAIILAYLDPFSKQEILEI